MTSYKLDRIVNNAVAYALLGGVLACSARSESGATSQSDNGTGNSTLPGAGNAAGSGVVEHDATDAGSAMSPAAGAGGAAVSTGGVGSVGFMPAGAGAGGTVSQPTSPTNTLPEGSQIVACPLFSDMHLTEEPDYIAVRRVRSEPLVPDAGAPKDPTEWQAWGTPCGTAPDQIQCQSDLEEAWPSPASRWLNVFSSAVSAVVTTTGQNVQVHETHEDILDLLGTIDTPSEALLWAAVNWYHGTSCDSTPVRPDADGYTLWTHYQCTGSHQLKIHADGTIDTISQTPPNPALQCGRRPEGVQLTRSCSGQQVGDYFAELAQLEEAAVSAFDVMRNELIAFDAPQELLRAAERAQDDERRHTQQMGDLARRYGTEPAHPTIAEALPRRLFDFALENAVEGCVRETLGAVHARYQSLRAQDPEVRTTLSGIAEDETRHAELSWAIHAWVQTQLSEDEREALRRAQQDAIATLRREAHSAQPTAVQQHAGSPDAVTALAMVDALEAQLWSKPLARA
jgi:hypothetical protein